jgi:hypothetical protein
MNSCDRCSVTNSLVPRVLGPTDFYLKVWINILNFRMFLGCNNVDQNVVVFFRILENVVVFIMILYLGSSHMNVRWVSRYIRCVSDEFLGFVHEYYHLHIIKNVVGQCLSRFSLECLQERGKWFHLHAHTLRDFCGPCTVPTPLRV